METKTNEKQSNDSTILKHYIKTFDDEAYEDYHTLTLVQENNPKSIFNQPTIEDEISNILKMLDSFFDVYSNTFSGSEQELMEDILCRIIPKKHHESNYINKVTFPKCFNKNKDSDLLKLIQDAYKDSIKEAVPNDQTLISLCIKGDNEVVGGMILEYYAPREAILNSNDNSQPISYCILTYIFLDKQSKKKGLGANLIKHILPIIISNDFYKTDGIKVIPDYVFFEVDNPIYCIEENETSRVEEQKCIKRLEFFRNVGARWLNIQYVQPKLAEEDKNRVYNLFFMILPEVSIGLSNPFIINKHHVLNFLISFYNQLEKTLHLKSEDFRLEGKSELKDTDLTRTWLSMEIADALDDFENKGDEIKVKRLRELKSQIENQFDYIADEVMEILKDKSIEDKYKNIEIFLSKFNYNTDSVTINEKLKNASNQKIIGDGETFKSLNKIKGELLTIVNKPDATDIYDNYDFYLYEVPRFAFPQLQFSQCSVALHLVMNSAKVFDLQNTIFLDNNSKAKIEPKYAMMQSKILKPILTLKDKKDENPFVKFEDIVCPIFNSYENDLLSYNYYDEKRTTKSKNLGSFEIEITFPYKIEYLSEGRKEYLFLDVSRDDDAVKTDESETKYYTYTKKVKCFLNYMYFKNGYEVDSKNQTDEEKNIASAKQIVWSLVFTNATNTSNNTKYNLSEYEIIRLSKFFSGKQEKSQSNIHFAMDKNGKNSDSAFLNHFIDILNDYSPKHQDTDYWIDFGTIQIETSKTKIYSTENNKFEKLFKNNVLNDFNNKNEKKANESSQNSKKDEEEKYATGYNIKKAIDELLEEYLKDNVDNNELLEKIYLNSESIEKEIMPIDIYANLRQFHYEDAFSGFEEQYEENKYLKDTLNAMCGITLGIFDYHRMGYEEVTDTILPLSESATNKAMILMKRGSVCSFCHENSVYESSINTIGISPYLIIPNSVLSFNRFLAEFYENKIKNIFNLSKEVNNTDIDYVEDRKNAAKYLGVNKDLYKILIGLRKKTELYIDEINIKNVFNYETEKEIYDKGMRERGIEEIISRIQEVKVELEEEIKDVIDIRQTILQILMAIFLGIASLMSIYDPMEKHINYEFYEFMFFEKKYVFNLGAIIFWIVLSVFIVYFTSRLNIIMPRYISIDWKRKVIWNRFFAK